MASCLVGALSSEDPRALSLVRRMTLTVAPYYTVTFERIKAVSNGQIETIFGKHVEYRRQQHLCKPQELLKFF